MPMKDFIVECSTCKKFMNRASIRRHKIMIHKENIPSSFQDIKVTEEQKREVIPFANIPENDPTLILLNKLKGCSQLFNGTKSAMQLFFSFDEYQLLTSCVKETLEKKEFIQRQLK